MHDETVTLLLLLRTAYYWPTTIMYYIPHSRSLSTAYKPDRNGLIRICSVSAVLTSLIWIDVSTCTPIPLIMCDGHTPVESFASVAHCTMVTLKVNVIGSCYGFDTWSLVSWSMSKCVLNKATHMLAYIKAELKC